MGGRVDRPTASYLNAVCLLQVQYSEKLQFCPQSFTQHWMDEPGKADSNASSVGSPSMEEIVAPKACCTIS